MGGIGLTAGPDDGRNYCNIIYAQDIWLSRPHPVLVIVIFIDNSHEIDKQQQCLFFKVTARNKTLDEEEDDLITSILETDESL